MGGRWERDRVVYEQDLERDRYEDDRYYMRGGAGRSPPPPPDRRYGRPHDDEFVRERRYYEEEPRPAFRREPAPDYDRRVVIEKDRERDYYRDSSPRRPAFLRRPSSVETYDRRPLRKFYDREEYPPPARREDIYREDYRAPPYNPIPLPKSRGLPPPRRYEDRVYEDINVAEPDYYGDEAYRSYPERVREREVIRDSRRRDSSRDTHTTRARTHRSSSRSSTTTSSSSSSSGGTTVKSEYPKKGKTRIPAKLVSKRAIIDIGYPFVEEGNVIVVQKALGQDNIDELLKLSEGYKKSELEVAEARSSAAGLVDERREEIFVPPAPAPGPPPAPIVIPPPPPPPAPVVIDARPPPRDVEIDVNKTVNIRDSSPSRTTTTSTSDSYSWDHSGPVPVGPMAIANRARSHSRTGREIRSEIRSLERELAHRPKDIGGGEIVRAERLPNGELVVYEESVERVVTPHKPPRIEKDKKGRMSISVPRYR